MGVVVKQSEVNGAPTSVLALQTGGETLNTSSGQIGALIGVQGQIQSEVTQVNTLAHNVISAVNQLHASGQGTTGYSSVTASNTVTNNSAALNSTNSGLNYQPTNGNFVITVTDTATGLQHSTLIPVNLTGTPGDTTLDSLTASLNAVSGVTATDAGGKLVINAGSGEQITFSQDTSGTLAALGINTFFTGSDGTNIAVNSALQSNPSLIAAAQNGQADDNQTALAIAKLETQPVSSLNGQSLQDNYQGIINTLASTTSAAQNNATATQSVVNALQSQQSSVSGVSIDEETVNLIQEQGAFQGAARLITVVNTLLTTLMNM
jgi:flagellar hook-associated protein 1 FlgK